jgi:hypothetical protein
LDSNVRSRGFRQNLATEHLTGLRSPAPVDLRAAYAFAREVVRVQPAPPAVGHRLVCVRGSSFACTHLAAEDGAFAIVGRHTQCNLVLADDPFVALRHLLARSIALPRGGVALRVLDLHTELGFHLSDGSRHASIFGEGPIAIAVGEYALVALPSERPGDELPRELPSPEVTSPPGVREQLEALAAAMSPYRANARPLRSSRITLMPRAVMVGEPLPPSLGRLATGGPYGLTLSRGGRSASVTLADEDVVRGVMIGRSEKCHTELLRRITDVNTSRTHVLVLREHGVTYAYDLASTQGTFMNGAPVRRARLEDGATLTLSRGPDAVRLSWHAPRA